MMRWSWREAAAVIVLFAAALAVRIYRLDEFPPGLFNDEAANGLDALGILEGEHHVFFERNFGREPFFIYFQAAVISLFGATPLALRLSAAFIGALTVPAFYWMVREAFWDNKLDSRRLAFYSALLLAFAYWHLSLSRIGFRAICVPLFAALAFAFFWRAWRRLQQKEELAWFDLTLCGIMIGGSLYTYASARILPLLVGLVILAGLVADARIRRQKWRVIMAGILIFGVAFATFAPLGLYFWNNPAGFLERSADVSIFSSIDGVTPWQAFVRSAIDTAGMFGVIPDPNLRHNPAQRPGFNLLTTAWVLIGLAVALFQWRKLSYFTLIAWTLLFALPTMVTSNGTPHSLRAAGMLPAALILCAIGMLHLAQKLPQWRINSWPINLSMWLPVPFLLYIIVVDTGDYFRAWQNMDRFHSAFFSDHVKAAYQMSHFGEENVVWILPLSPNYHGRDPAYYTIDFLYSGKAGYSALLLDDDTAPAQLEAMTQGKQFAYLIRGQDMSIDAHAPYLFGDPKQLAPFLLQKHGQWIERYEAAEMGVPFDLYALAPEADFQVFTEMNPHNARFDHQIELTGVDYGPIQTSPAAQAAFAQNIGTAPATSLAHTHREIPQAAAGEPIWVVMQWKTHADIAADLKVVLALKDERGHVVGQVDQMLVGDHYPLRRTWHSGESTRSYHIVPVLPASVPGEYQLTVKVYDDQSLRSFPVRNQHDEIVGQEFTVGILKLLPASVTPEVEPAQSLHDTTLSPSIALLGYDLAATPVRPGDTAPLALYWQALDSPEIDYRLGLTLRSPDGSILLEHIEEPAGIHYPTSRWQSGQVLRSRHDLPIPAEAHSGRYSLAVTLLNGAQPLAERTLGEISVTGRPRLFEPPARMSPMPLTFDSMIRLMEIGPAAPLPVQAGGELALELTWRVEDTPQQPLMRFVHLLGDDGHPLAQEDTVPCAGECPASSWLEGEYLMDNVSLTIPAELAAGNYTLGVGWYNPDTFERVPVVDNAGNRTGDMVHLPLVIGDER